MGIRNETVSRYFPTLSNDPNKSNRNGTGDGNQIFWGTVGHEGEDSPSYIRFENGQPYAEVTIRPEGDEIIARVASPGAGADSGWYIPLFFGCRVLLECIDGETGECVIVGRLWDNECFLPGAVAGVSTGADNGKNGEVTPASAWQFIKTGSGQMLGIETGANGDIAIHSSENILLKTGSSGALHVDGATHLGVGPTTDPVGATVGPNGEDVPGTPAVAHVPIPLVPGPPPTPVHIPFIGSEDSMIRAKELAQFSAISDPIGYTQFAAVYFHPLILLTPPVVMVSSMRNGPAGVGSKHTASD